MTFLATHSSTKRPFVPMKAGPRLELRQGQSLVMTQQLQQSIKLLQCTSLELRQFVEQVSIAI